MRQHYIVEIQGKNKDEIQEAAFEIYKIRDVESVKNILGDDIIGFKCPECKTEFMVEKSFYENMNHVMCSKCGNRLE